MNGGTCCCYDGDSSRCPIHRNDLEPGEIEGIVSGLEDMATGRVKSFTEIQAEISGGESREAMSALLNRLFGQAEEINGRERCPTYLYRWILLRWRGRFTVYLHHFVGDDWSLDLHDHPKRFISIGLWGWYVEETPYQGSTEWAALGNVLTTYRAPWIRTFAATHIHRLTVPSKNCWTLVIVLKPVREWGFWHLGRFIPWRSYVNGEDAEIADKMKACN